MWKKGWGLFLGLVIIYFTGLLDRAFEAWGLYPTVGLGMVQTALNAVGALILSHWFQLVSAGAFGLVVGLNVTRFSSRKELETDSHRRFVGVTALDVAQDISRAFFLSDPEKERIPTRIYSVFLDLHKIGIATPPDSMGRLSAERRTELTSKYLSSIGQLLIDGHYEPAVSAARDLVERMKAEIDRR